MTAREVVERHRSLGRPFDAGAIRSFVREEGSGEPVVCLHGVPMSSLPLSPACCPSWPRATCGAWPSTCPAWASPTAAPRSTTPGPGWGASPSAAVDALELDRFHLVVHDIGGPVGFELAAAVPERVRSLTVLNTIVEPDGFKRPWMMEPFAMRGVRFAWLRTMTRPSWRVLYHQAGHQAPPRGAHRRGRRPPAAAQAGRRRALVPAGDARLRAHGREERPVRLGPAGPLPGPGGVGRARPRAEDVRPGREGAPRWRASTRSTRCRASTSSPEDQAPAIAERVAALAASR